MKKSIVFFLLISFCNTSVCNVFPVESLEKAGDSGSSGLRPQISYPEVFYRICACVDKTLDYVTNPKGILKIAIVLSPIVYAYCCYQDISIVDGVIYKVIQSMGNAKAQYDLQFQEGVSEAFWDILSSNPLSVFSVYGKGLFKKVFYDGLPFIGGLLFKFGLGVK